MNSNITFEGLKYNTNVLVEKIESDSNIESCKNKINLFLSWWENKLSTGDFTNEQIATLQPIIEDRIRKHYKRIKAMNNTHDEQLPTDNEKIANTSIRVTENRVVDDIIQDIESATDEFYIIERWREHNNVIQRLERKEYLKVLDAYKKRNHVFFFDNKTNTADIEKLNDDGTSAFE